ncbi:hypothetical protein PG999_004159 [Apiospora kogelbergensis]|uniref:Uncharacterized protein n=2 Tax=Apiospora kogelbergensis TaxID=1337665 RepID=A0AAW0R5T0_9PEZI
MPEKNLKPSYHLLNSVNLEHPKMTSPLHINASCPSIEALPEAWNIAGIPLNITTYFTPAQDAWYQPMTTCCSPNPVGLAEGCYFWCEQPPSHPNLSDWSSCVRHGATNGTKSSITAMHKAGAARFQMGAPEKMAMVVLAVLVGSACTWF